MKTLTALTVSALTFGLINFLAQTSAFPARPEIIYEGDSLYHHITITQSDSERCMLFGRYKDRRQTCVSLIDPDVPVLEYAAMMFAGFFHRPDTKEIALIGLGGGYIPSIFRKYLPDVELDVVEVDPKVAKLAGKYFGFKTSEKIGLTIADGRQYLKRTPKRYGQIWLDAFNSDYIPIHMTTREFLLTAKSRLTEGGILMANVHNNTKLFDAQVLTFRSVFKSVYVYTGTEGRNSVIVAADEPVTKPDRVYERILKFGGRLGKIDLTAQMEKYSPDLVVEEAEILTDDYNPANLWLHRKKGGQR